MQFIFSVLFLVSVRDDVMSVSVGVGVRGSGRGVDWSGREEIGGERKREGEEVCVQLPITRHYHSPLLLPLPLTTTTTTPTTHHYYYHYHYYYYCCYYYYHYYYHYHSPLLLQLPPPLPLTTHHHHYYYHSPLPLPLTTHHHHYHSPLPPRSMTVPTQCIS